MIEKFDAYFGSGELKQAFPSLQVWQIAELAGVDVQDVKRMGTLRMPVAEHLMPGWDCLRKLQPFEFWPSPHHAEVLANAAEQAAKAAHRGAAAEQAAQGNHVQAALHAANAARISKNT